MQFILYSRSYCHLCDDMLEALLRFKSDFAFSVDVIDIDADEQLVSKYDELVPVLVGIRNGMPVKLCHYFLNDVNVRDFLTGA